MPLHTRNQNPCRSKAPARKRHVLKVLGKNPVNRNYEGSCFRFKAPYSPPPEAVDERPLAPSWMGRDHPSAYLYRFW